MIQILNIEPGSIAAELGIRPGARLISMNGKEVEDQLDYRFYVTGDEVELLIEQDGEQILFEIEKDYQEDVGLVLEDLKMRKCGNKCVFCFVHQNPRGLRKSLYFKDEDYRFSFLYGHYVTLSNTRKKDLQRIVEQRLTPLYISVHATEPELRKFLLGIKFNDHLLDKIKYLTDHGIEINAQVVLCPEVNDGAQLDRTLSDLKSFYPQVRSVAVVPLGMTRYRRNLPALKPVTDEYSRRLIDEMEERRARLKSELGSSFVYLSDEFYIKTGVELPDNDYYEGFYQLENGVGLTRDFINRFEEEFEELYHLNPEMHLTLVSGALGGTALRKYILPRLGEIPELKTSLVQVTNRFWGEAITVSGLLVGQDIYDALKSRPLGDYVVLPPRVLNHDGLFLDDWNMEMLEEKLGKKIFIFPDSFLKLFENIYAQEDVQSPELARKIRHTGPVQTITEPMKGGERGFLSKAETIKE